MLFFRFLRLLVASTIGCVVCFYINLVVIRYQLAFLLLLVLFFSSSEAGSIVSSSEKTSLTFDVIIPDGRCE